MVRRDKSLLRGLYGITAEEYSLGRSNREVVTLMLASGIRVVHTGRRTKARGKGTRSVWSCKH